MPKRLRIEFLDRCIGCYQCSFACSRITERVISLKRASIRVKTLGGYSSGSFSVITCRGCIDPPCQPVCPIPGAIRSRNGGGVLINRKLCDTEKCNNECVEACSIPGAIHVDTELHCAIVCRQCGTCVNFCPTGVLIMEEIGDKTGF
jgi:Fe-S-cluster-containing dehydrogenase component